MRHGAQRRRSHASHFFVRAALVDGPDAAFTAAKRLLAAKRDGYVIDENEINTAGCVLMTIDHPRESLGLLRWNTERFPASANTWDSLAWAYSFAGDGATPSRS